MEENLKEYWIVEFHEKYSSGDKNFKGKILSNELLKEIEKLDEEYRVQKKIISKFYFEHIKNNQVIERYRIDVGSLYEKQREEFMYLHERINEINLENNKTQVNKIYAYVLEGENGKGKESGLIGEAELNKKGIENIYEISKNLYKNGIASKIKIFGVSSDGIFYHSRPDKSNFELSKQEYANNLLTYTKKSLDNKNLKYRIEDMKIIDKQYNVGILELFKELNKNINFNEKGKEKNNEEERKMSKVLEFLNEKIEGTEKKIFTTMSPEKLEKKMKEQGMSKEEYKTEMENLFKNKKLFYLKSEEEKINYDGTYKIVEDYRNRKWFTNEDNFNEFATKEREFKKILSCKEEEKLNSKKEEVQSLSDNAKKVFESINTLTRDGKDKAYVGTKEVIKESKLSFEQANQGLKELKENKIAYITKISKTFEKEENGEKKTMIDEKFVCTNSDKVLAMVLKRESIKKEIEKSKEIPKEIEKVEEKTSEKEDNKKENKSKKSSKKKNKESNER